MEELQELDKVPGRKLKTLLTALEKKNFERSIHRLDMHWKVVGGQKGMKSKERIRHIEE